MRIWKGGVVIWATYIDFLIGALHVIPFVSLNLPTPVQIQGGSFLGLAMHLLIEYYPSLLGHGL